MMSVMAEKEIEDAHVEHKFLCDTTPTILIAGIVSHIIPWQLGQVGVKR